MGYLCLRPAPWPAGRLLARMNEPRVGITGPLSAMTLPAFSFAMTTAWFLKSVSAELFTSLSV